MAAIVKELRVMLVLAFDSEITSVVLIIGFEDFGEPTSGRVSTLSDGDGGSVDGEEGGKSESDDWSEHGW
jgi:hypothetical protein